MTKNIEGGIINRLVLNKIQREAVVYNEGSQLVFAGAGTGKTRVLTAKIAYLLDLGVSSSEIFAATFTNKAANEMRERVEKFTNTNVKDMWLGTFHSLCARLLRRESRYLGFPQYFSIYDRNDQESLLRKARKEMGSDERSLPLSAIISSISALKQRCITPEEAIKKASDFYEKEIANIYLIYQRMLKEQAAMDFDDLLMNSVILLRDNERILNYYNEKFRYILIDEFQDTNNVQLILIKLLGYANQKIFVVGDDDQSIYEWRGAKIENILNFSSFFSNVKIFKLEQNYRSTGAILDFANEVIKENKNRTPKKLWTQNEYGSPVTLVRYRDDRQEAADIAETILLEIKNKGLKGGDIAILFRTNAQSRIFEEEFRKRNIPYIIVAGMSFYERSEIKDCLAYLRLLVNPADNVSFERIYNVPARGLGEKALETLYEISKKQGQSLLTTLLSNAPELFGNRFTKGFSELKELFLTLKESLESGKKIYEILKEVLEFSGYIDMLDTQDTEESVSRKQNILELEEALFSWSQNNPTKTLADFLEEVSLITDIDTYQVKEEAVNMMTMHSAKGLEFKRVFIVGLEDGIIPSKRNFDDASKIEEERRLLYVAVTRSMENLTCSFAETRYFFGELVPQIKSRFLINIDPSKYEFVDKKVSLNTIRSLNENILLMSTQSYPIKKNGDKIKKNYNEFHQQSDLNYEDFSQEVVEFRRGQYVRHSKYGKGRIIDISGFGDDMRITVLFNDGSRRKLLAKVAKLEGC